ncbi:MAG: hypothetical protein COU81_03840 [Candidatus Portnoybacteria bacterium CG10_big_fil_rev_8_21_14_0_10_36_7]|uniref:Glycosyltransferase RgtA/B/C/D-like domain-containing protein n=1 Tax=Candidatus Portnoybacteria bacterium CG10_big_fil_rev_8_21_14_0_10_36_7 TaxID=1974812 RepID=A0A2M8KD83_9BACT|nr:MAG: hypothetical protein COU81_03840 [Candidatus Portnoybacteria bacterium CG10_big_fil_rev_8_21_14_0_10_36_7]
MALKEILCLNKFMEIEKKRFRAKTIFKKYRLEIALFVVALVVRLVLAVFLTGYETKIGGLDNFSDSNYPIVGGDSHEYNILANNLIKYGIFSQSPAEPFYSDSFRIPGYPLFLAVISKFFGGAWGIIIIQSILSALSVVILFKIATNFVSRKLAGLTAWFFVFEPVNVYFSVLIFSESLFTFLILSSIYIFINKETTLNNFVNFFLLGLILGIGTMVRVIGLFVPMILFFFGYLLYGRINNLKKSLAFLACILVGFILVIAPWSLRNKKLFNSFSLSSVSLYNLVYYHIPRFYEAELGQDPKQVGADIFEESGGTILSEAEYNSLSNAPHLQAVADKYLDGHRIKFYWFFISHSLSLYVVGGWRNIAEYLKFLPQKVIPLGQMIFKGKLSEVVRNLINGGLSSYLLVLGTLFWIGIDLLMIVGVFMSSRGFANSWGKACLMTFFVLILYFMVAPWPEAGARMRIPAEPFMFLLAMVGLEHILTLINHE